MPDKLNRVDYSWYLVRTQPGHERDLCALIGSGEDKPENVLEAYCPTHTMVCVRRGETESRRSLFDGYVFVLATRGALVDFLRNNCPNAALRYNRKTGPDEKAAPCTIPEPQMRAFREFNENYADKVVVLERPYTDYAFNKKTDEPNEIVRVVDGPLAGCKGYVCRFNRKRGLVFHVQDIMPGSRLTVTYPNVYDLHVVRLHNAEGDRLSVGTEKGRAVDLIVGILQGCGYGERTLPMLYDITDRLATKPSLVSLCKELHEQGDTALSRCLAQMTGKEAELIINLARYEHDNPGFVRADWSRLTLRPFLTPTAGVVFGDGNTETELHHKNFTEVIRKVDITEDVYYPSRQEEGKTTTTYYAHIGIMPSPHGGDNERDFTLFANWDGFLGKYFLTAGKANEKLVSGRVQTVRCGEANEEKEKLIESFRNFAPTLYKVLTDAGSDVKAVQDFKVGNDTLNVLAISSSAQDIDAAKDKLINTCVGICTEINTTNRLAVWRRYMQTVWLHE